VKPEAMPAFQYAALDADGRTRKGVLEGDTARQVRQLLRERALVPIEVAEVAGQQSPQQPQPLLHQQRWRGRINATELALLTRQLATLIGSGLPIEQALGTVAQQSGKARLNSLLLAVRARVLEGHSLATALQDFPRVFPELFRATVAAGEQSGHLEIVFERLADYTENRQNLRQKVGLALFYPLILTLVAIAIVIGLLAYVVPQVVQVFASVSQQLPLLTRALIATSEFLNDYGWLMLGAAVAVIVCFSYAMRYTSVRFRLQQLLLGLPLLGRLLCGLNSARFAHTFSILTASGVPVLDALRIAAQVIGNLPMRTAIQQASGRVKEGGSLHKALAESGYFPPMAVQLIASGEASGRLDTMLERAAIQQERETDTLIAALLGIFEPLLILTMGAIVLVIVLAILLPIFDLNQIIH
jgi:general secretion pathway protein F